MPAPHFKTVKNLADLSGVQERIDEGLARRLGTKYGVRFRIIDEAELEARNETRLLMRTERKDVSE